MNLKPFSLINLFKTSSHNLNKHDPFIKVELSISISFETYIQVSFLDEDRRPRIKEFYGKEWSKELIVKEGQNIRFSVFINNQHLKLNERLILIKKINGEISEQKEFLIKGENQFEGWFQLN